LYGLLMAFQNFQLGDMPGFSPWVGFKHIVVLFQDHNLNRVVRNTVAISLLKLLFTFPAPIFLALLFNEIPFLRFKKIMQTISYMPHFLSWVVVSAMMFELFSADNGIVNHVLMQLNIVSKPILFMGDSSYFWTLVVGSDIWKETGWGAIIYVAAIMGIDQEQYEAAQIDGAGRISRIWHITMPGIMPTVMILFILAASNILSSNFDQIMMMTGNLNNRAIAERSDVLDTFIYSFGIRQGRFSFATAASFIKSVIGATLLILANQISKWAKQESLW
jgi:putative aldouronate transport system permease protein